MENEKETLEKFLNIPVDSTKEVFEIFKKLPNAIHHNDGHGKCFVYIPGTRPDRILLVAHADTVWDENYTGRKIKSGYVYKNGFYTSQNLKCGIGADDRAGCAMLYLLRNSGHSLLITDGEEYGQISAHHIKEHYHELFEEFNNHSFMIQLDRRNCNDVKFYNIPVTDEFVNYILSTGYKDAGKNSRTDIVTLCDKICGVNFSVGYYNEHTYMESLSYDEWKNTLDTIKKLIEPTQKKYPLD